MERTLASEASSTVSARWLRARRIERAVAFVTIVAPLAGGVFAATSLRSKGLAWIEAALCIGLYLVTILGITMGFHRLFTHRSFECARALRVALGIAGSMAAQGPLFFWVATHRVHHATSDTDADPHSPRDRGTGPFASIAGFWHAHVGWMLRHAPENYARKVPDLAADEASVFVDRWYLAWVLLGLALPAAIGGWASGSWAGAVGGFLWGGLVRVLLAHHATWSVNSVCHLWGSQRFRTGDGSRNNALCALLTLGEGWHNNHHALPSSARHGLGPGQVDPVFALIRLGSSLSLIRNVRLPSEEALVRRSAIGNEAAPTPNPSSKGRSTWT
jgi:stearoyl-CoA desaturase (delta-9 desaturase)